MRGRGAFGAPFRGGFAPMMRGGMGFRGGFGGPGFRGGFRGGFAGGGMGLGRGGFGGHPGHAAHAAQAGQGAAAAGGRDFSDNLYADFNGGAAAPAGGMAVDQGEPNQQIFVRNVSLIS